MIGPSPANQAVLIGTDLTLTCRRGPDGATGAIVWEEDLNPVVTLFLNEDKQTSDAKYANFYLDSVNVYDLLITSIAVEDEGTYLCRNLAVPNSDQSVTRTVEGEVTPEYCNVRIIIKSLEYISV